MTATVAWPDASTAGGILERIRRESRSEHEKGRWFENLFLRMMRDMPEFEVAEAHRWPDWPDRKRLTKFGPEDVGIDLVATLKDGSLVAIQCKCYDESGTVQREDIDSFLAVSGPPFSMRWIVATCGWGRNAEEIIRDIREPPVRRIDFHTYDGAEVSEGRFTRQRRIPLEMQERAIDDAVSGLTTKKRGQLIMACGTGKTYTSLRIAEKLVPDGGRVLFLAPSIALVTQVRQEWLGHAGRPLRGLVVCSDGTSGGGNEGEDMRASELACPVTTSPEKIARFLRGRKGTRVVFCTYQSLGNVSAAQLEHGAPDFDLAIADEAHRTTGIERLTGFQTVHDNEKLHCKKRLYMTATQRIYTPKSKKGLTDRGYEVRDMDDLGVYGPVLHRLSFKDAVKADRLSDYRVIVMGVHEDQDVRNLYDRFVSLSADGGREHILTYQDVTRLLGTALAINGATRGGIADSPPIRQLSKVLGFSNTRARSKAFTRLLNMPELHDVIARRTDVQRASRHKVTHLDGTSSALERNRGLRELAGADAGSPRMLCNVRLFTEGVDVPSLDAVAFLDPRRSPVDVVQAVGRVMRRAEGKRFGYIIVPFPLAPGENLIRALETDHDGWKTTGEVLRALQSHDGRLPENPLQFIQLYDPGSEEGHGDGGLDGIQTRLDFQEISEKFYTHVVGTSGLARPGEDTAAAIKSAVDYAARQFAGAGIEQDLARTLGLDTGGGFTGPNVSKIAALLVTNACLLHRRLLDVMPQLEDLNKVGRSDDPCGVLAGAWTTILERDYSPVFEPALGVVDVMSRAGSSDVNKAAYKMADCANRVAASLSELGYDHSGPLYHNILGTAQSDSAYYTHNVSAVLLARLALTEDFAGWTDTRAVNGLRIMDPACGTGTLLMAALETIKWRMDYDSMGDRRRTRVHRGLVENVMCGLDINRHAVQLAACNMTLGAPTVDYANMNLYTMRHGPGNGAVRAGSLEMLRAAGGNDRMHALVLPMRNMGDVGGEQVDRHLTDFPLGGLDMVIMNPPFGSNTSRNRKFPPQTTRRMQDNELAIIRELTGRDPAAGKIIDMNSIETFFTPLADRLLKPERGTLAQVMPVTACTGASALGKRKFLSERFHVERIITTHDPKRVNFSYNTSIHECLMICRRHAGKKPPTRFVALRRMPGNAREAKEAAEAIAGGDAGEWGASHEWPAGRMAAGDWSPAQWYDGSLAETAYGLERSPLLEPAGLRHRIGPAGQGIRGTYEECERNEPGARRVFRSIGTDLRRTIYATPESWQRPKAAKAGLAERYWDMRSSLLVATRFRTTSSRLTAVCTGEPSVGSGWVPVSVSNEREARAMAVWWNSTPVMMMLLNRRSKLLTYPQWSQDHLNEIKIPRPDSPGWEALRKAYDRVCDREMQPLHMAATDPVRKAIDGAAARVLGEKPDVLAGWRRRLSLEPTVANG